MITVDEGKFRGLLTLNTTEEKRNDIMRMLFACSTNSNLVEARVSPACEWLEVDEDEGVTYETDCENKFVCGEWEELYKTFEYCIYCGGKIKVKKSKSG